MTGGRVSTLSYSTWYCNDCMYSHT